MIKKSKFVPFAFTVLVIGLAALRRARNRQSTAENVSGVKKVTTIFAGLSQVGYLNSQEDEALSRAKVVPIPLIV